MDVEASDWRADSAWTSLLDELLNRDELDMLVAMSSRAEKDRERRPGWPSFGAVDRIAVCLAWRGQIDAAKAAKKIQVAHLATWMKSGLGREEAVR